MASEIANELQKDSGASIPRGCTVAMSLNTPNGPNSPIWMVTATELSRGMQKSSAWEIPYNEADVSSLAPKLPVLGDNSDSGFYRLVWMPE